jgi:hypothetical protein
MPGLSALFFEATTGTIGGLRASEAALRLVLPWFQPIRATGYRSPNDPLQGRYGCRFPTRAQITVDAVAVTHVALYDEVIGQVEPLGPTEAALLSAWIGSADPLELEASGVSFQQRRQERANSGGRAM